MNSFALHPARVPSAQGRAANLAGRYLEDRIEILLEGCNYGKSPQVLYNTPCFVRQYRQFKNLYNKIMINDFFVVHPSKYPQGLIIECKQQNTRGSADEKFPFTIQSLQQTGRPVILIAEGLGFKEEALVYCEQQALLYQWFRFYRGYEPFRRSVMRDGLL